MQKNRNVGIIGVGQSVYSSHREEVNQPEMIHEAVAEALAQCRYHAGGCGLYRPRQYGVV